MASDMTDRAASPETQQLLTAADAARAALAAQATGRAVTLVMLVSHTEGEAGVEPSVRRRRSLDGTGAMRGSLGEEREARTTREARTASSAGRRLLLDESGAVRGSLGQAGLDAEALALARGAMGDAVTNDSAAKAATHTVEVAGDRYTLFVQTYRAPAELLIVGAGHIAVPLARLGAMLGFRITVLDDREEFAATDRFPEAAAVIRADFTEPFREVSIGPRTHVVLVTRAHKYDFDCLRLLLEREVQPCYVGLIGSRRRIRAAFHALLEGGLPRDRLARVHAPVGLDIGAETPEEIAVSIAAELIQVRRSQHGGPHGAMEGTGTDGLRLAVEATEGESAETPGGVPPSLSERERVLDRFFPEGTR